MEDKEKKSMYADTELYITNKQWKRETFFRSYPHLP